MEEDPSDDLSNELAKLLSKSRRLRAKSSELEAEIARVTQLIKETHQERNTMSLGSLAGDILPAVNAAGAIESTEPLAGVEGLDGVGTARGGEALGDERAPREGEEGEGTRPLTEETPDTSSSSLS
jgi:hypothetical protein